MPSGLLADASHQKEILPGGRAALLGSAFTGLADDPSCGYYNPAGCVFAPRSEISVTGNALKQSELVYKEAINGTDFKEVSTTIFPSFVGALYNWQPISIGYSYMMLDAKNINQNDHIDNIAPEGSSPQMFHRTHQETNTLMNAGANVALRLGKYFSLGAAVFYYVRDVETSDHMLTRTEAGSLLSIDYKYSTKNEGLLTSSGLMLRLDTWSIGVSIKTPKPLNDRTVLYSDITSYSASSGGSPEVQNGVQKVEYMDELIPRTYQVGMAWFPSKSFQISGDVSFHEGRKHPHADKGGQDIEDTVNYAIGFESVNGSVAVRLGAFSNNSLYAVPQENQTNQPTHIDYIGASAGLGFVGKSYEGMAGVIYQTGTGTGQIVIDSPVIQDVKGQSTTYLFGGKYGF